MTNRNIVIFDLDETLTQKGTWGRFVVGSIRGKPLKWPPFVVRTLIAQIRYMLGHVPRSYVKETMMCCTLHGHSRQEVEAMAEIFAQNEVATGLRAKALHVLERHKNAGDRILIASAAVDLIVDPIAKRLGIDEVVCTKMAYCQGGYLEKKLGSANCYGQGKLDMVKSYLAQDADFKRDHTHITMYSDSRSDLAILCWADVGIAVHPSPRLAKCVDEHGFEVQTWD